MITSVKEEAAEYDWISLLLLAKEIGVTAEEIRAFIKEFQLQKKAN
ncbi:anti-repressor SinI [Paenibacillus taihuensis]|uniref:Anti-repressor SinI n=1 Tax=Paenibacillus taihuensis TaxID=1156355 RepID=A0A3D9SB89_9BACL|nr:DNA-binding anti-repressor SinI [Paenibacillus taihuensis]REE90550.1 anti-repressor SinI [Paenibacillus taihuensis]